MRPAEKGEKGGAQEAGQGSSQNDRKLRHC